MEKIRLVFLVLTPEIWSSIGPVWRRAVQDDRFDVSVVLLKRAQPEITLISLCKARALFESSAIPYFTEQTFSLEIYRPHVVFYSLPYGSLYPESYRPERVAALGCRIAYVSYGLEVGGGMFNARYQYDTEVPRIAWRIFARSKAQLKAFGRHCSYGNGHVVVTGHPREETDDPIDIRRHGAAERKARGRRIILWTPHFSVITRRKWSSFLDHHEAILKLIDDSSDLFLLVRPHPLLFTTLEKCEGWCHQRVRDWFNTINGKDNVHVDIETDYRPAFQSSSALMADAGSFLVEYLRTGKPLCYLTGRDDIGLNEEVSGLDCFYPGATTDDIANFLSVVVRRGEDSLQSARQSAARAYFGASHQTPSQSILDHIHSNVGNTPPRHFCVDVPMSTRHADALCYWLKATTTFLAPNDHYQIREAKLGEILRRYAKGRFAADVGCGNGRFTLLISEFFEFIDASDPSERLICEAREIALQRGVTNIAYSVERLEHPESLSTYDFVSCMGVTSSLLDDDIFIQSIYRLKAAMRRGAVLLMKDTLNVSAPEFIEWNGYTAVYRSVRSYIQAFEAAGLFLVEEVPLAQDLEKDRINSFYLFMDRTSD